MPSLTHKPSTAPERREAVEQRVMEAVERLLEAGHRYTELSVGTIAEAAGVARSTFYVHFTDKSQLLIRLAEAATADMVAEGARWIGETGSGIEQLTQSIGRVIAAYRNHERLFEAIIAGTAYDSTVAAFWRRHIEVIVTSNNESLRAAQVAGLLNPDVDIDILARMVAWTIERTITMHAAAHPPSEDAALAATMARALWLMTFGDSPSLIARDDAT